MDRKPKAWPVITQRCIDDRRPGDYIYRRARWYVIIHRYHDGSIWTEPV